MVTVRGCVAARIVDLGEAGDWQERVFVWREFPGKRYEDWTFDDPAGLTVEDVRPIRDAIEQRIRHLLDELNVPAPA